MKRYELYLNGAFYGRGPLSYMLELIEDYVGASGMYGKESCEFVLSSETSELS